MKKWKVDVSSSPYKALDTLSKFLPTGFIIGVLDNKENKWVIAHNFIDYYTFQEAIQDMVKLNNLEYPKSDEI